MLIVKNITSKGLDMVKFKVSLVKVCKFNLSQKRMRELIYSTWLAWEQVISGGWEYYDTVMQQTASDSAF